MKTSIVPIVVISLSSFLSISLYADESVPKEVRELTVDGLDVSKVIANNMIKGSEDGYVIPSNVYYRFIFEDIISNQPEYITAEDWRHIQSLPSHNDDRFLSDVNREVGSICSSFDISSPSELIAEKAALLDETTRAYEARLDQHYQSFISLLSPEVQTSIQARMYELAQNRQVGYARLKFSGVAAESPELAVDMMLTGCSVYKEHGQQYVGRSIKMVDEKGKAFSFDEIE